MCTDTEKCEQRTIERVTDETDAAAGINILTMLLARGKEPDEIMAALAMALATFNVICVPDKDALDRNHASTTDFIRKGQEFMWPNRDRIENLVRNRVARILPFAAMLDGITGNGGGDRPKEPAEPQHEQFKV